MPSAGEHARASRHWKNRSRLDPKRAVRQENRQIPQIFAVLPCSAVLQPLPPGTWARWKRTVQSPWPEQRKNGQQQLARYWNPSFRIVELAESVLPPRNQGEASQLTWPKSTELVTVMMSPADAAAGSGVTWTTTWGTDTPSA